MKDTNNFYGYLPGGFQRPETSGFPGIETPKRKLEIAASLDTLIEKQNFNVALFKEERGLWHSKFEEAMGFLKSDPYYATELGGGSMRHCENVQRIIYPLYLEMLRLGYSKTELIQ